MKVSEQRKSPLDVAQCWCPHRVIKKRIGVVRIVTFCPHHRVYSQRPGVNRSTLVHGCKMHLRLPVLEYVLKSLAVLDFFDCGHRAQPNPSAICHRHKVIESNSYFFFFDSFVFLRRLQIVLFRSFPRDLVREASMPVSMLPGANAT